MTNDHDMDLAALFEAEDQKLAPEPFTRSVMTRISYASMVRRGILLFGSLIGAIAALLILPSGLIGAMETLGQFELPKLTLDSLPALMNNPYSAVVLAVGAGLAALAASWGLEKAG